MAGADLAITDADEHELRQLARSAARLVLLVQGNSEDIPTPIRAEVAALQRAVTAVHRSATKRSANCTGRRHLTLVST